MFQIFLKQPHMIEVAQLKHDWEWSTWSTGHPWKLPLAAKAYKVRPSVKGFWDPGARHMSVGFWQGGRSVTQGTTVLLGCW